MTLALIPDDAVAGLVYSPKGAKLKTITFGNITLREGVDYKAVYDYSDKKYKSIGSTVTVRLTGKGVCKGTTNTFSNIPIVAAEFENDIQVQDNLVIDIAKQSKRSIKVTDYAGVMLKENKDYIVMWDRAEKADGTQLMLAIYPVNSFNDTRKKTVSYHIASQIYAM